MTPQEKARERAAKWQKENPERRKEIRAKWIANNFEKMREIRKEWKLKNPDKVLDNCKKWMKAHPEVRIRSEAKRRTRKTNAGGSFTTEEINDMHISQNGLCAICKIDMKGKFHRDHIMPICLGGSSNIENIQLLCPKCNMQKSGKHPDTFNKKADPTHA